MPGGLLPLVSFGKQNVVVNGNPQITFFYKTFKRHSHFSEENITIPLEGPQELNLDMPIRVRAKIQRFADLARSVSLRLRITDIYSKIWGTQAHCRKPHEFQWVHQLGTQLIQSVAIFIGGSKIQEFPGEWLSIRAQLDYNTDHYAKWRTLIGDTPELNDPKNGINADPTGAYYPNVIPTTPTSATQTNNPSIPGQYLLIPLPFWFTEGRGNALPLKALEYHEVEVQITFRPLRNLYTITDASGFRVRYGYANASFPTTTPETLNADYVSFSDVSGAPQNFYMDYGYTVPATEYFNLEPTLQVGYVYLSDDERKFICEHPLEYVTTQVQSFQYQGIANRVKFDLDAHNMIRRMVWLGRRSDAIVYRNDYLNCTNWKYADVPPYKRGTGVQVPTNSIVGSSGTIITGGQRNILRSARILCNGNEIFEEKPANYFEHQQTFDNILGTPTGIVGKDSIGPLYLYSFATKGSDVLQPSGSLNASVINNFQLEVNVEPLPPNALYDYEFTVYVESINFVHIQSGQGALRFAI
jgi:hypothetical protein